MRRSAINRYILEARAFFENHQFILPPYSDWTLEDWKERQAETSDIRTAHLGWDVTDFNSGDFESRGLTLFTLRNGSIAAGAASKSYAEKIMFVRQNQLTPFHYHLQKTEDIINRGGKGTGSLAVQLYHSSPDGEFSQSPVSIACDGIQRTVEPGATIILGPGESITLVPGLYHAFHAVDGDALIGEVSSINDDSTDNYFKELLPRFSEIIEDEPPIRALCNEYPFE